MEEATVRKAMIGKEVEREEYRADLLRLYATLSDFVRFLKRESETNVARCNTSFSTIEDVSSAHGSFLSDPRREGTTATVQRTTYAAKERTC